MFDCQDMGSELDYFGMKMENNAYQHRIPLRGTFELTARCNFNCGMCYVHLNENQIKNIGRELTNEEWLRIAREARDAGMLYLTLTGGEVFVRPGFRELYEELSDMGFLIQIYSNGYLINEETIQWLSQRPPMALRFTLYGASNETYQAVCGVRDGFDSVSRAIDLVKDAGIQLYMVGLLVKENIHELEAMHEFAKDKNLQLNMSSMIVNPVRGATADAASHRIDVKEYIAQEVRYMEPLEQSQTNLLEYCGNYRKGFWLTWNGNLQLCAMTEYPAVSLVKASFTDGWTELNKQLNELCLPEKCCDCKYEKFCMRCPGMLAAESGNPDEVTESYCSKARMFYESYFLYRKKGIDK